MEVRQSRNLDVDRGLPVDWRQAGGDDDVKEPSESDVKEPPDSRFFRDLRVWIVLWSTSSGDCGGFEEPSSSGGTGTMIEMTLPALTPFGTGTSTVVPYWVGKEMVVPGLERFVFIYLFIYLY